MDTDIDTAPRARKIAPAFRWLAAVGPGVLVMLADTDAGNVVTAAQAGAQWGLGLLPLVLALAPALFIVQELAARLGVFTGRGFGELVREQFGRNWALAAFAALALACFSTLVTEFSGIAGVGALYDVPRGVSIPWAALFLLAVAATRAWRRFELIALVLALFEGAFLLVAWRGRAELAGSAGDMLRAPLQDRNFLYLAAALTGAVFSPWMIFYQQAATVRQGVGAADYRSARWDTGFGAVLTQLLTGAVLVAAAGALRATEGLSSIGDISRALTGALGAQTGRLVFSLGVTGASFAAAIVAALALSWGVTEIFGGARQRLYLAIFAASVAGAALIAGLAPDLVALNIAAQLGNALLFPLTVGLLVTLAARMLEPPHRLHGAHLLATVIIAASVALCGVAGLVAGLF